MSEFLGPDARALLDATRDGDDPSAADAARVRAKLAAKLGVAATVSASAAGTAKALGSAKAIGTGATTAGLSAGAGATTAGLSAGGAGLAAGTGLSIAAGSALTSKVVGAVAVVLATSGAGWAVKRVTSSPAEVATPSAVVVSEVSEHPDPQAAQPAHPAMEPPVIAALTETSAPVVVPSAAPSLVASSTIRRAAAIDVPSPPEAPSAARANEAIPAPSSAHANEAIPAPSSAHANEATPASASPAADPLLEEAALLREARTALARGDGTAALATLDRHERRFSHGVLTPERLATRVLALCALGRQGEAQVAARTFLGAHPASPLARSVERSCIASDVQR